jgi:carbon monoxide dehydrogenase subunit G
MSALEFSGVERFSLAPADLFAKLCDMDFVAAGIPDLASSERTGPLSMNCKVRPSFAFLRGTLDMSMAIVEHEEPSFAKMRVAGKGIGASLELETTMQIDAVDDGSELRWQSQVVQLGGLLKSVSKGLIQGAASKVSSQVWADLHKRLEC